MKTLLLIRHAKAEKEAPSSKDFDRPLATQGRTDASLIAQRVKAAGITPQLLITSSALRAITTARLMAKEWGYPEEKISREPGLYYADMSSFHDIIQHIDNKINTGALFSHNPVISQVAASFTDSEVDHFPTCGALALRLHCDTWKDFLKAKKEILLFEYPGKTVSS